MLQVHGKRFVTLLSDLREVEQRAVERRVFDDPQRDRPIFLEVKDSCDALGLLSASKQSERLYAYVLSRQHVKWSQVTALIAQLRLRVEEDLEEAAFYQVEPRKLRQCFNRSRSDRGTEFTAKAPEEFFSREAVSQFPSAIFDINEARECFLTDRSTACVFHLMRALEVGLTALADHFGVPSGHTNWHNIIEGIEKAVRDMGAQRDKKPNWKEEQEFYSKAASHLMFLKDAWRNQTMHGRAKYTESEAELLLDNVRAFMNQLAGRLGEPGI